MAAVWSGIPLSWWPKVCLVGYAPVLLVNGSLSGLVIPHLLLPVGSLSGWVIPHLLLAVGSLSGWVCPPLLVTGSLSGRACPPLLLVTGSLSGRACLPLLLVTVSLSGRVFPPPPPPCDWKSVWSGMVYTPWWHSLYMCVCVWLVKTFLFVIQPFLFYFFLGAEKTCLGGTRLTRERGERRDWRKKKGVEPVLLELHAMDGEDQIIFSIITSQLPPPLSS